MRVLALSPHTDDIELGAGGYISKLVSRGNTVTVMAFSRSKSESDPANLCFNPMAELSGSAAQCPQSEWEQSMKILGVADCQFLNLNPSRLADSRQEILEHLILWRTRYGLPDLVLCPAQGDCHQDHETITNETIRAFKMTSILGYALTWNAIGWSQGVNFYIPLTEEQLKRKESALVCYGSQRHRKFFAPDVARVIARFRGEQCGHKFAEGYQVIRWIA